MQRPLSKRSDARYCDPTILRSIGVARRPDRTAQRAVAK
jgi:hypothetical protein